MFPTIVVVHFQVGQRNVGSYVFKIDTIYLRIIKDTVVDSYISSCTTKPYSIIAIIPACKQVEVQVTILDGHIISSSVDSNGLKAAAPRITQIKIIDQDISSRTGNVYGPTAKVLLLSHGHIPDSQIGGIARPQNTVVLPVILGMAKNHIFDGYTGGTPVKAERLIACILQGETNKGSIVRIAITPENIARYITAIGIDGNITNTIIIDIAVNCYIGDRNHW